MVKRKEEELELINNSEEPPQKRRRVQFQQEQPENHEEREPIVERMEIEDENEKEEKKSHDKTFFTEEDQEVQEDLKIRSQVKQAKSERQSQRLGMDTSFGEFTSKQEKIEAVEGEEEEQGIDSSSDKEESQFNKNKESTAPIEPFNLRQEKEEGYFDANGMYIPYREREDDEEPDEWLSQLKPGHKTKTQYRNPFAVEEEKPPVEANRKQLLEELVHLLQPGETVGRALNRYRPSRGGGGGNRRRGKNSRRASQQRTEDETNQQGDREKLNRLTEVADLLMSECGYTNVFTDRYENFVQELEDEQKQYSNESKSFKSQQNQNQNQNIFNNNNNNNNKEKTTSSSVLQDKMWEFKWNPSDSQVYGPYPSRTMSLWSQQHYFEGSNVHVREIKDDMFADDDDDDEENKEFVPLKQSSIYQS